MASIQDIENALLLFLSTNSNKKDIERSVKNFSSSDWQKLSQLSVLKGLYPPFYSRAINLSLNNFPWPIAELKDILRDNLVKNAIACNNLVKVTGYFRENNIPAIPLKGAFMALYLYGDLALRRVPGDMDLLIKQEDFENARSLLKRIGYKSDNDNPGLKLKYNRQLRFTNNDAAGKLWVLDLHCGLRSLFIYSETEDLWSRAVEIEIEGVKILSLNNEDLLIYLSLLCMTITESPELRYFYDLHIFIENFYGRIDWEKLGRRLCRHRHKACVFFALKLSREFFHTNIPDGFMRTIRPGFVKITVLKPWINRKNVLYSWDYLGRKWYFFFSFWHYFISSYLYSQNILDCLGIICRKVFIPIEDMPASCNHKPSFILYIERLLKPARRCLNRANFTL